MEVIRKGKPINWHRVIFVGACLFFPIVNWLVFYVYANFSSFGMAFTNSVGEISFDNFVRFYNDLASASSELRIAFRNTFLIFAITVAVYPFQVLVSYFIYKKIPFYGFYRIVFFLPQILFSLALSLVFSNLIGVEGFIAKGIQEWLHLDYVPELLTDSRFANIVLIVYMLWLGFPGSLIIWGGTFARIPQEVLESAQIDGVSWWQEFTKIIVPLVWPTVSLQMILMSCSIFSATTAAFELTGGQYGTMTFSCWMFLQMLSGSGANYSSNVYNYMSAVGLCVTVVAVSISLVIRRITGKFNNEVDF